MAKKSIEAQRRGVIVHQYENIEIVEVDGIKRVRRKDTGEIIPMKNGKQLKRAGNKW